MLLEENGFERSTRDKSLQLAILFFERLQLLFFRPLQASVFLTSSDNVFAVTPCRRINSAIFAPAFHSCNTWTICSSVNRVFRISPLKVEN